jgi:hypothetical protein
LVDDLPVQQRDDLAARCANNGSSAIDADLGGSDAHALAEHVCLGDAFEG